MKRIVLLFLLSVFLFSFSTSISESVFNRDIRFISDFNDSIWNVKPIAKTGDPSPGVEGKFLEFGTYHLFKTGEFIFWAKFKADKKSQFWGLYWYKKGEIQLLQIQGTAVNRPSDFDEKVPYTQMGGVNKFHYTSKRYYQSVGGAYIEMWNSNTFTRLLSKGDTITLPDSRSAILDYAVVDRVTNDNALISFNSRPPDKGGWMIHDGVNLKPVFFRTKENLPGTTGTADASIKSIYGYPYIADDTVLAVLTEVDNQLKKSIIHRFTKDKTEKILADDDPHPFFPEKKLSNPQAFNIQHSQKFLVFGVHNSKKFLANPSQVLLYYNDGQWKSIIEDVKELPESQGFDKYSIDGSQFLGQKKDSILFSISLLNEGGTYPNTYVAGRLPLLMLYDEKTLKNIPWYQELGGSNPLKEFNPKKNTFSPIVISKIPGFNDLIIKIPWYQLEDRKNLPQDFSLGNYLLDPADKDLKLRKIMQFKTSGPNSFTPASIIGWLDTKRVVVKSGAFDLVTGFFELSIQ